MLQLHQLETADIPVWRSEQLDEEAAYADERFGYYLPTAVRLSPLTARTASWAEAATG